MKTGIRYTARTNTGARSVLETAVRRGIPQHSIVPDSHTVVYLDGDGDDFHCGICSVNSLRADRTQEVPLTVMMGVIDAH